ncbi:MAG: RsmB/NOP family class I SAM-dependent RNA methyltransferase, partial [Deltaproteobacteria bacterium]|nr:RsmB/NOP family class I SAM-dependent RNA methyltransferase [Deltaproteobacteria bacterium]
MRKLLLTLWRRTRVDWSFASSSLADSFRANKLGGRERRAIAECLYGMIRHHRRIDEALAAGGYRSGQRAPDEERIVAYLVLEEGLIANDAVRHFPDLDWQRVAAVDETLDALAPGPERLARRHSFPDWLAERLVRDLGDEAEALARSLSARAPMTVRVNRLKSSPEELMSSLAERDIRTRRSAIAGDALVFETRLNLFSLPEFKAGCFEAQDEGSQLIAELVMPPPKAMVVDFCAGAGGKTLAIAAAMAGKGRILATDIYKRKLDQLRKRCRRAAASNVQTVVIERDPKAPWPDPMSKWVGKASRVLIDAPCTGIGSLRRNP